jgi:hypothetical protein
MFFFLLLLRQMKEGSNEKELARSSDYLFLQNSNVVLSSFESDYSIYQNYLHGCVIDRTQKRLLRAVSELAITNLTPNTFGAESTTILIFKKIDHLKE